MPHFKKLLMENSQERLVDLIQKRVQPNADKAAIDRSIKALFGEEWFVMFTDLSGFSRNAAEFGIIHFIQVIVESERLFAPILEANNGFVVKREGDSLLVLFRESTFGLACAKAMQEACETYNNDKQPEDKVLLCVGLSHGQILRIGSDDVFGEAVNVASKLGEYTTGPGDILITAEFLAACEDISTDHVETIGEIPPGSSGAFRLVR